MCVYTIQLIFLAMKNWQSITISSYKFCWKNAADERSNISMNIVKILQKSKI